jgi:hypothetical protein
MMQRKLLNSLVFTRLSTRHALMARGTRPFSLSKFTNPISYIQGRMAFIDSCREAYLVCANAYDEQPKLMSALGMPKTFENWFAWTILHVWMVDCRLKVIGDKKMQQEVRNFTVGF